MTNQEVFNKEAAAVLCQFGFLESESKNNDERLFRSGVSSIKLWLGKVPEDKIWFVFDVSDKNHLNKGWHTGSDVNHALFHLKQIIKPIF